MDEQIDQLNLSGLANRCSLELMKRRRKEASDDSYCLEIFRRAIIEHDDEAWSGLQECFSETVRIWIRSHASSKMVLMHDSEENYVAQTFSRFWVAVHEHRSEFRTLNGALSYLHVTLDGIFRDIMRSRRRSQEVPLPEQGSPEEPMAEQHDDDLEVWNVVLGQLNSERERRIVLLLYYHGLTPKAIVKRFPHEFPDVREIHRVNGNVVERLRRKREQLRWVLSS